MATTEEPPATRTKTAVVIPGTTVAAVRAIGGEQHIELRANRQGVLITGRPGARVIDYADVLGGPVYDLMYNARTGWFSVTVYTGHAQPTRWDNRPDDDAGYERLPDVLGATTPSAILAVLDVDAELLGYAPS